MSMIEREEKLYNDGRTKQAFKDSTDINKMLKKAQQTGSLEHLKKYPELVYGQFDGEMDLLTARAQIDKANAIFADTPSEVRREFGNDPLRFVAFMGDPANAGKVGDLLKRIAEPGNFVGKALNKGVASGEPAVAPETPEVAVPPSGEDGTG